MDKLGRLLKLSSALGTSVPGRWQFLILLLMIAGLAFFFHNEKAGSCRFSPTRTQAVGRNEPAVPSAAVRLGWLGSGGSARRLCRPADSAGRTTGRQFGRPSRPARPPEPTWPVVRPAGWPAEPPPGGPAGRLGQPNRRAVPTHPPHHPG